MHTVKKVIDPNINFHLFLSNESNFYDYFLMYLHIKNNVARYIRGQKCNNIKSLFNEFAASLQFPYYFGENWTAFDECLNDLEWFKSNEYMLFISHAYHVLEEDNQQFKIFIDILSRATDEWHGKNVQFHIIFHAEQNDAQKLNNKLVEAKIINIDTIVIKA
jgi:hypothetical protein